MEKFKAEGKGEGPGAGACLMGSGGEGEPMLRTGPVGSAEGAGSLGTCYKSQMCY